MTAWVETLVSYAHESVDERVREALWARGVSESQIEVFRIGYMNRELPPAAYPKEFLEWSGDGRKLVDCYLLPLTNALGEILGFQFRSVDRGASGYMDFFLNRAEAIYLGLGSAMESVWRTETVLLVEGGFDFFPVQRFVPNSFPTLTAKVPESLLRTLKRLVRKFYLFYDADRIGQRVSETFVKNHGVEFESVRLIEYPRGVTLPNGKPVKDPGELWEAWGDDRFGLFLQAQMEI
jgi:DNA primase